MDHTPIYLPESSHSRQLINPFDVTFVTPVFVCHADLEYTPFLQPVASSQRDQSIQSLRSDAASHCILLPLHPLSYSAWYCKEGCQRQQYWSPLILVACMLNVYCQLIHFNFVSSPIYSLDALCSAFNLTSSSNLTPLPPKISSALAISSHPSTPATGSLRAKSQIHLSTRQLIY